MFSEYVNKKEKSDMEKEQAFEEKALAQFQKTIDQQTQSMQQQ